MYAVNKIDQITLVRLKPSICLTTTCSCKSFNCSEHIPFDCYLPCMARKDQVLA